MSISPNCIRSSAETRASERIAGSRRAGARRAGHRHLWSATQRLVDDAIALGQPDERRELLLGRVRRQVEVEANALKSHGSVLRHAERAAEIQIAVGRDPCVAQIDTD